MQQQEEFASDVCVAEIHGVDVNLYKYTPEHNADGKIEQQYDTIAEMLLNRAEKLFEIDGQPQYTPIDKIYRISEDGWIFVGKKSKMAPFKYYIQSKLRQSLQNWTCGEVKAKEMQLQFNAANDDTEESVNGSQTNESSEGSAHGSNMRETYEPDISPQINVKTEAKSTERNELTSNISTAQTTSTLTRTTGEDRETKTPQYPPYYQSQTTTHTGNLGASNYNYPQMHGYGIYANAAQTTNAMPPFTFQVPNSDRTMTTEQVNMLLRVIDNQAASTFSSVAAGILNAYNPMNGIRQMMLEGFSDLRKSILKDTMMKQVKTQDTKVHRVQSYGDFIELRKEIDGKTPTTALRCVKEPGPIENIQKEAVQVNTKEVEEEEIRGSYSEHFNPPPGKKSKTAMANGTPHISTPKREKETSIEESPSEKSYQGTVRKHAEKMMEKLDDAINETIPTEKDETTDAERDEENKEYYDMMSSDSESDNSTTNLPTKQDASTKKEVTETPSKVPARKTRADTKREAQNSNPQQHPKDTAKKKLAPRSGKPPRNV